MEYAFILHAHGLDAWRYHKNNRSEHLLTLASADTNARATLQKWLAGAHRRCLLIADVADERHIVERLPRTSRTDRHLLLQRRMAQHFPDTPLTNATPLPVSPDDGVLNPIRLAALTRPDLIAPWLDVLGEAGTHGQLDVQRLTSVPFLLEHWYRRQRNLPPQALLLTLGAGGMRQIFFRQRRLAFSRVIPARADTLPGCLPAYSDELAQTLAWLATQRLSDGAPPVKVLANASELPALRELTPVANGNIEFLDLASQIDAHKSDKPASGILPLALQEVQRCGALEHLPLSGQAPGHYNCPQLHHPQRLATARRSTVAITVALVASSLTAAALDLTEADRLRLETEQLATRAQTLQNEIGQLRANTPDTPDADALAHWLDNAERLARNPGIAPATVLQAVSDILAEAPWVQLAALTWEPAQSERDRALLPNAATSATSATSDNNTAAAHVVIRLEIDLDDNAPPPQSAADTLGTRWQRQHGTPMQTHVDADRAHLQLSTVLALPPPQEKEKGQTP
jgi:hypothetical protein